MIQQGVELDDDDKSVTDDDLSQIAPYCPSVGIVIDAVRAAQLIMQ
jgi:hypothetical protein